MRRADYGRLFAIALVALTVRSTAIGAQTELVNGQNLVGTVSVPGEYDQYFFYAQAGDTVVLSIAEVGPDSPAFTPGVSLSCDALGGIGGAGGQVAGQFEAVIPFATTCFVRAGGGTQAIGDYTLRFAKIPGAFAISPGDEGGALINGSNHLGMIDVGDFDMWSFTASAGDAIMLRFAEIGPDSALIPWIRLKGPTGQDLGSDWGHLVGRIDTTAPVTGTYTVIVSASALFSLEPSGTGDYLLTLVRTPGPYTISPEDEGGALTNGANHTGVIHAGDLDAWSFEAAAGDAIFLRVAEVGGDSAFTPWIKLSGPTGQDLGTRWSNTATLVEVTASVTGIYTVTVASGGLGFEAAGSYTLGLARVPGAFTVPSGDEGGPVTIGANHLGAIQIGDLDMWTFDAAAGDVVVVSIGEVGGDSDFSPRIQLRGPTGQSLGGPVSGTIAARILASTTVSGTYTVIVDTIDTGLDGTGDYTLTIAVVPSSFVTSTGDQGGAVAPGSNPGAIHVGDVDLWTFPANAGDVVRAAVTVTNGTDFSPWVILVGSPVPGPWGGNPTVQVNFVAPITGVYAVIVASHSTSGFGDYNLEFSVSQDLIRNGTFDEGEAFWQFFATPSLDYIVHDVTAGLLEYYRVAPPPGTTNQAAAYQNTGIMVQNGQPLLARFDLANTSTVRKRISVLVLDASFGDLSVCTFWLEPNAPMRTYQIRTHTTMLWGSAALYFYAATAGEGGGRYQIDNVSLRPAPGQMVDRTECVDPTAPTPSGGPPGPNLLINGDFNTGALEPWFTFGTITALVFNGTLNFTRPSSTSPSGVIAQQTGQAMTAGEIISTTFRLGNGTNGGRRRVTVILHDADFSDLSACTFWLEAGQPRSEYVMRTYVTKPWANAMLSVYPATVAFTPSLTLDDVTFQRTPGDATVGTECLEPGAAVAPFQIAGVQPVLTTEPRTGMVNRPESPAHVDTVDLRDAATASLLFESKHSEIFDDGARALLQVSLDGRSWITLDTVPPSDDWLAVRADLSAFLGEVVRIRFVLDIRSVLFDQPVSWRVRGLYIQVR